MHLGISRNTWPSIINSRARARKYLRFEELIEGIEFSSVVPDVRFSRISGSDGALFGLEQVCVRVRGSRDSRRKKEKQGERGLEVVSGRGSIHFYIHGVRIYLFGAPSLVSRRNRLFPRILGPVPTQQRGVRPVRREFRFFGPFIFSDPASRAVQTTTA